MPTSTVIGSTVRTANGEEVGRIKDVVLDRNTGCMAYTVLTTGGSGGRTAGSSSTTTTTAPQGTGGQVPSAWVSEQVQFITGHQLADGAILSSSNRINPYFANVAAMGLAKANTPASRAALVKWMKWYVAHLNQRDASGLSNTVYDYNYDAATGRETPVNDYDSVDSYAATALSVAAAAYDAPGPDATLRDFVSSHIATYEAIANLLDYGSPTGVREANGLTFAKPSYRADYLMDNSEVYAGLADFSKLEQSLGRTSQANYYGSWANTSRQAILSQLWNPGTGRWDWALGSPSTLSRFYPDAAAQLWPTLFGVVSPSSAQASSSWAQFKTAWPNWSSDVIGDGFPWTAMARAGQLMGEKGAANQLLSVVHTRYAPAWAQPSGCSVAPCGSWYDAEAGWFLRGASGA